MKIVLIYGKWSSSLHGPFDVPGLYATSGLTGSESSFFNAARGLAQNGHEVLAVCDCEPRRDAPMGTPWHEVDGAAVAPIDDVLGKMARLEADAVIAWNEPPLLAHAPPGALRVCAQQLNDFSYCEPSSLSLVDLFVFPSRHHADYMVRENGVPAERATVVPNSVNLEHFTTEVERDPHRVIYCSSPDRGLHHLLAIWPEVKARVPQATLRIFYHVLRWAQQIRDNPYPTIAENRNRANYVMEALHRLRDPKWGVVLHDSVSNRQMAVELKSAAVLAYPCDPIRYTEGFGVSVLDAAAAGCLPIISEADSLPSVHGDAAVVVRGGKREDWIETIIAELTEPVMSEIRREAMRRHAARHERGRVAAMLADALTSALSGRRAPIWDRSGAQTVAP